MASTLSSSPRLSYTSVAAAAILQGFLNPKAAAFDHPPLHSLLTSRLSNSTSASVIPRLYLACALTPYTGVTYEDGKKRERPAVEAAIREGLKIGTKNHYLDGIPALFIAAEKLKSPIVGSDKFKTPSERVAIGAFTQDDASIANER